MIRLDKALNAWGTPAFETILKQEIAQLDAAELPLQQGLTAGNYVSDAPFSVMLNHVEATDGAIRVEAGIFYQGVLGGCSCGGDPTTASESAEYCVVQFEIDRKTAATTVKLVTEEE